MDFLYLYSSTGESFAQIFNLQSMEVWLKQSTNMFLEGEGDSMKIGRGTKEEYLEMSKRILKLLKICWKKNVMAWVMINF